MTVDEIKSRINGVFSKTYTSQVYFVLKCEDGYKLRLADIEDETEPELRKMFAESVQNIIVENEDLSVCPLSAADDRANALFTYDYEEYPDELSIFRGFNILNVNNIPNFSFSDDDISALYGYIVYLGSMTDGIILFKKHYPISLIKRESFLLGAVKSKERFERINNDDIIRLNGDFQLVRISDKIFVKDVEVLERSLGFKKLIFREASAAMEAIEELAVVEDVQVLRDSADDVTFARKLSKIKNNSPIFTKKISKEIIVNFTKTNPGLKGIFKYSDDGQTIRLDTQKSKNAFVKLLNDAFLHSELTKEYYEARAKDNISNS